MEMEMIGAVYGSRGRKPGQQSHRDHDGFLHATRPCEVSAQYCRQHDAGQVEKIVSAFDVQAAVRLDFFDQWLVRFDLFLIKHVLVVEVEYDEKHSHSKCPLGNQVQGPLKRNPAKESKEQRRIS